MNECPVCERELIDAPGIGQFCNNSECPVNDDVDLWENGQRKDFK